MEELDQFAAMLKTAKNIVFFGGAGVSTESGLKDYRSADGIYNTAKCYGLPPEEILSESCFDRHPELFYRFYRDYFVCDARPGRAHIALAKLQAPTRSVSVVTQNIDGLHQRAGSKTVYELHGNSGEFYCRSCRRKYGTEALARGAVPHCDCGGVIKPKVTLYGEMLDDTVIDQSIQAISQADLLIIGGTSLAVQPAASFISYFQGENTVVINKEVTPYDRKATLIFHESIGEILEKAVMLALG